MTLASCLLQFRWNKAIALTIPLTVALLTSALLQGCATTRFENTPLAPAQSNVERRVIDIGDGERPLVLLAFSGGGSRASALGWAVLQELQRYQYDSHGQTRRLTDDVAVISSASGGSVIAADFALYGADGLDAFKRDFLLLDNTRTLNLDALNPLTWMKLAITGSTRIDLVEQLFDAQLFKNKTYADLNQPGKPYLIANATDMASGNVFPFTPPHFDDICADLDQLHISTSVAASAAVPIIFSPMALRNYSSSNCPNRAMPQWVTANLNKPLAPYLNIDDYRVARYTYDLRGGKDSHDTPQYLYLLDGGLADNLGVHGLIEAISSPYAAPIIASDGARGSILQAINNGKIKKIVVIVVNARAAPTDAISQSADVPGIVQMIGSVTSTPIDSTTNSMAAQMDALLQSLTAAGNGGPNNPAFAGLKVYGVLVDFDLLRINDPAQFKLQSEVNRIPTSWTISSDNLDAINQSAILLLHQHPCFQHLLMDMRIANDFTQADFAKNGCRQPGD
jgi:NTE family protein